MVGVHVYLLSSSKKMKPLFQGYHNGQQLLFSDRVSSFSRLHFQRHEGNRSKMSLVFLIRTSLCSRGPYAILRNIRVQMPRLSGVDSTEMCHIDHCLLRLVEVSLMQGCPLLFEICFKDRGQGSRYNLKSFGQTAGKFHRTRKTAELHGRWSAQANLE